MKNSPANGRGTPRDDMPPASGAGPGDMGPYMGPPYQDGVSFGSLWYLSLPLHPHTPNPSFLFQPALSLSRSAPTCQTRPGFFLTWVICSLSCLLTFFFPCLFFFFFLFLFIYASYAFLFLPFILTIDRVHWLDSSPLVLGSRARVLRPSLSCIIVLS